MSKVLQQNIRTIMDLRRRREQSKSTLDRFATFIGDFAGSFGFIVAHVIFFAAWVAWNTGALSTEAFDPAPFSGLGLWCSAEAIFLSAFILMRQNQMTHVNAKREELDLQMSLLTESELTELVRLVEEMARRMGIEPGRVANIDEVKEEVRPETVINDLEREERTIK